MDKQTLKQLTIACNELSKQVAVNTWTTQEEKLLRACKMMFNLTGEVLRDAKKTELLHS